MRRETTRRLMVCVFAGIAGSGLFAAETAVIRVKVPFEFRVGDTRGPAGEYEVSKTLSPRAIQISSFDTKTTLTALHTPSGTTNPTVHPNALIFNRYGDIYFLREIWISGETAGARLARSQTEKKQTILLGAPKKEVLHASTAR